MNKSIFNECFYKAYGYHACPTGDPELEKFAECIVKEYLSTLCVNMYKHNIDLSNLPAWYKVMIETDKHFGIEE